MMGSELTALGLYVIGAWIALYLIAKTNKGGEENVIGIVAASLSWIAVAFVAIGWIFRRLRKRRL